MTIHAVMHFPWSAQPGNGGSSKYVRELQCAGEDKDDVLMQVEKAIEQWYLEFLNGKPGEITLGFCEDGEPIEMKALKENYSVKISVAVGIVPKPPSRKASVKRKAKK